MSNTLFKKAVASAAALSIVLSVVSPVVGVNAADVSVDAANRLAALGIINNNSENPSAYRLNDSITRWEMAKVMLNLAGEEPNTTCEGKFSDVTATKPNDWVCGYVEKGLELGFLSANSKFRPNDSITEAETLKMVMEALGVGLDTYDAKTWVADLTSAAVEASVISETTKVSGVAAAKRSFVFTTADAWVTATDGEGADTDGDLDLDDLFGDLFGDGSGSGATSTGTTNSGSTSTGTDNNTSVKAWNLEVSLNPASASASTVPRQGLVTFGKFDFTAGDKDVSIDTVTLKREGLSERSDIKRVYFEKNSVRVSTRANVATDDTVLVSFNPALVVKAWATETLDLIVELKDAPGATVGAEHAFAISKIESSANLQGSLPRTAMMRIGSYVVQSVTISAQNTSTWSANVGDKNVLFAEFQLQTTGDRDNIFKTISLRNEGTLNLENLSNLAIYNNGKVVSTNVSVSGREVTFAVNSEIENGKNERYEIRADIISAERSAETVSLQVRNSSDVVVVEKATNFSAPIAWVSSALTLKTVEIKGGNLLLSRDTSVNSNQTVSPSTSDVVLLAANFNVNEALTIEDVRFDYTTGSWLANQFNSLRLVVNGRTVSTLTPDSSLNTATGSHAIFDTTFTVSENSKIQILGNLKNTAASTFKVNSLTLGSTSKRYVSNDETATIDGSVTWVNLTINTSTAILVRNDGLTNDILVPGAQNVTLLGFSVRASDVSDIRLSRVQPTVSGTLSGSVGSKITNIRLMQGDNVVSTKNNFDFSGLDLTISKNTSASFKVVADFTNAVLTGSTIKLVVNSSSLSARDTASNNNVEFGSNPATWLLFAFDTADLKVAKNSSQVARGIFAPSSSEASVFKFDLEAKNDNLRVTDLYVVATGWLKLNEAVKSVSMNVAGRTVSWDVIWEDTIYFAIGNTNPVSVKRDETVVADVRIAFNDDNTRSSTGFTLEVKDPASGKISWTHNGIRVISEATGEELDQFVVTNVKSNTHLYSRTKAIVARLSNVSDIVAYEFSVTADANRKLSLSGATFAIGWISGTGAVRLYEKGNTSNTIQITDSSTGQLNSTLTASFSGTTFKDVSAGSTKTFVLEITNVDTSTSGNKDKTRTVRLDDITFTNDLTAGTDVVSVKDYNLIPTDSSTWKY